MHRFKMDTPSSETFHQWADIEVNVALCGLSGTGKSQFINTVLGVTADDAGAAPVNIFGSQRTVGRYVHPEQPRLIFWDLPGIGTGVFGRENYFETVEFNRFDFYLIFGQGRFYEEDAWLVQEVDRRRKRFFYVRTHIDKNIASEQRNGSKNVDEKSCLDTIRQDCEAQIRGAGVKISSQVYLISAMLQDKDKWDFRKLNADLLKFLPGTVQETAGVAISVPYPSEIKAKIKTIRGTTWQYGVLAAIPAALPLPFVPLILEALVIFWQARTFTSTISQSICSLSEYWRRVKAASWQTWKIPFACALQLFIETWKLNWFLFYFYKPLSVQTGFTVFGCGVSAVLAYRLTHSTLDRILRTMEKEASK